MLDNTKSPLVNFNSVRVEPRRLPEQNLAHVKRTAVQRALLAADLANSRALLINPTLRQAVLLTGASTTYAIAAAKLDPDERRAVANGSRPLVPQSAKHPLPKPAPSLADAWDRATPEEREAVVRPRVAHVWGAIEKVIA